MRREVTTVEDLRTIVGQPNAYVANKVKTSMSEAQRDWLAHSPLGFLATTGADGRVDVSPKGDPPGFVHIIGRHHHRHPGAARQQAGGRLPQRAAAAPRRHGVQDPRAR